MVAADAIYHLASEVVLRDADQVCFHTANGCVVRFNEVGYATLLHFVEPNTLSNVAHAISRLFSADYAEVDSDVHAFVADLITKQILIPSTP